MNSLKEHFLTAPDGQFDVNLRPLVEEWDDPPTSLQLLKVIDFAIHGGGASEFALMTLQLIYHETLKQEGKQHEDNIPLATWRKETE